MPVCGIAGRECPSDCLEGNAVPDVRVFRDVFAIVVTYEITPVDLPECTDNGDRQKKINERDFLVAKHATEPVVHQSERKGGAPGRTKPSELQPGASLS